jgi:HEAT repeat protein
MIISTRRMTLGLAVAMLASLAGLARGNGWEHTSAPFEAVLQALGFEDAATRAKAAQSLGYRRQPAAVAPLLTQLEKETDPAVRSAIYTALGSLGDQQARPAIFHCLEHEERPELRADCAAALAGMQSAKALNRLLALLDPGQPLVVRARAVDAIGGYDQERAVEALVALVRSPDDADPAAATLRRRAISALGRTGAAKAAQPLVEALQQAEDPAEQIAVLRAIARVATPAERPPLEAVLRESQDQQVRTEAIVALAATEATDLRASLEKLLTDTAPAMQLAAIDGLSRLGEREAAPALASHADGLLRQLTARGAEGMAAEPAQTVGRASLLDAALRAMVALDAEPGLTTLLRAAEPAPLPPDGDAAAAIANAVYQVRRTALHGLGYTGAAEAAEMLLGPAGIGDADPRLRAVAARSLALLDEEGAIETLIRLLEDPAPEVRGTAAEALGGLADPQAIEPLRRLLADDPDAQVRRAAAQALGWLGDATNREALAKAAEADQNDAVRSAATLALRQLKP